MFIYGLEAFYLVGGYLMRGHSLLHIRLLAREDKLLVHLPISFSIIDLFLEAVASSSDSSLEIILSVPLGDLLEGTFNAFVLYQYTKANPELRQHGSGSLEM